MRSFLQRFFLILITCLQAFPLLTWADTQLKYQDRGTYHEGIKPKPVSGYDIELISVLADYREPTTSLPESLTIQFYLPETTEVHLTVREIDYRKFYWLDQVRSSASWAKGFGNTFSWSTETVLQSLDRNMDIYDLGVLTRLGQPTPASIEYIAPAILYHTVPPTTVKGYWFTLKPNGRALVNCAVYPKESDTAIWSRTFRRKPAGQPFSVEWDASHAQEGSYMFLVTGYFLDSNQPIQQTVHFYHRPTVK
ncbi:hypothetical protein [Candidatus Nitronereus thalassa]|uniref:Intracellular proteinase inhibitor BsuPI domain-containing protein n=1 Tax=Candidatus Nitronereus thalassa TaxID=3020898 RepID=A0ABU3K8S1_9BACT|nr:hypothetical protein [Candidatus Nitronereus thalassa]MDT7042688.1 hypothetical protein [Candidatus Nitronereus thalassa]